MKEVGVKGRGRRPARRRRGRRRRRRTDETAERDGCWCLRAPRHPAPTRTLPLSTQPPPPRPGPSLPFPSTRRPPEPCPVPLSIPGVTLGPWRVFPLPLDDADALAAAAVAGPRPRPGAPALFAGTLTVPVGPSGAPPAAPAATLSSPPSTWADVSGWGKGLLWVGGAPLGWYWPARGPQMRQFVPGPVLASGANPVVLLELLRVPEAAGVGGGVPEAGARGVGVRGGAPPSVVFRAAPDFTGPHRRPAAGVADA